MPLQAPVAAAPTASSAARTPLGPLPTRTACPTVHTSATNAKPAVILEVVSLASGAAPGAASGVASGVASGTPVPAFQTPSAAARVSGGIKSTAKSTDGSVYFECEGGRMVKVPFGS